MTKWPFLYDYSPFQRRDVYLINLFLKFLCCPLKMKVFWWWFKTDSSQTCWHRCADGGKAVYSNKIFLVLGARAFISIYQKFWTLIAASVLWLYTAVWDFLMLLKTPFAWKHKSQLVCFTGYEVEVILTYQKHFCQLAELYFKFQKKEVFGFVEEFSWSSSSPLSWSLHFLAAL